MTTGRGGDTPDPMRAGSQLFESGYRSMTEGWQQAQEFWNNIARSWGGAAGSFMTNPSFAAGSEESMKVLRELQEAAFAVGQAWMRMPLTLMGGSGPQEIQEATNRLAEAQGRAYQLWMEALSRGGRAGGSQP